MSNRAWLAMLMVVSAACGPEAPRGGPGDPSMGSTGSGGRASGSAVGTKPIADPGTGPVVGPPEKLAGPALTPLPGCDAVVGSLRAAALAEMNARLDANLKTALAQPTAACQCVTCGARDSAGNSVPPPSTPTPAVTEASAASSYSTTNNQVVGVDEADFVKNDGGYIYLAAGGGFQIVDAWPPDTARTIARVAIEGTPRKLFVEGDRALVYSSLGSTSGRPECTYGYGCQFQTDGQPTKLTILDIRDRAAPRVVRQIKSNASFLAARRVGAAVHTVLGYTAKGIPNVATWPPGLNLCSGTLDELAIRDAFETLRANNVRLIGEATLDGFLPTFSEIGPDGAALDLVPGCSGFFGTEVQRGSTFTTVLSLDMVSGGPANAATIVSAPGAVYASAQALYMSVPSRKTAGQTWYASLPDEPEASAVHKFQLENQSPPGAFYAGSGVVKGHVLGQFAMDERDGVLRIATTTGQTPAPNVHSTLTMLTPTYDGMVAMGVLDQIAPTEDIRAVRFDGDRGYVVTFKKTDPLFVFDLSNPAAPQVRGELKIPGFSTYIHRLDEGHLLSIGYDADDHGTFAYFDGVLLQIFDVTDPTAPALVHKTVIGTRGSSSEALTNHLAFNYFAPKHLLMIPMTVCEGGDNGVYGKDMTFSGLLLYDATVSSGFAPLGGVSHPPAAGINCTNWWTNAKSQVKRSIVMDDYVFSISDTVVRANAIGAPSVDLATVPIGP